jgi:hypothetical protein
VKENSRAEQMNVKPRVSERRERSAAAGALCFPNRGGATFAPYEPCRNLQHMLADASPGARAVCEICFLFAIKRDGGTLHVTREAPPRPPLKFWLTSQSRRDAQRAWVSDFD